MKKCVLYNTKLQNLAAQYITFVHDFSRLCQKRDKMKFKILENKFNLVKYSPGIKKYII